MPSIYRNRGLSEELDPNTDLPKSPPTRPNDGKVFSLKKRFSTSPAPALSRTAKTGFFWGVEELRKVVDELEKGGFDGLRFCYGQRTNKLEIVAQQIKFNISAGDASQLIAVKGKYYTSVPDISTEPPVGECPPLTICNA
jgi:hypothetical protein